MTPEEAVRRFASARVARLATVSAHGLPRLVPITFALIGDRVVTAVDSKPKTTQKLARLEDVTATGVATVLVDHYADRWDELWWVRASGPARLLDLPAPAELIDKYPQYREQPPRGRVIEIGPVEWRWWEGSVG